MKFAMRYVICAYVHKIKNIRIEVAGLDVLAFEVCRRRRLAMAYCTSTVRYNVQHQNSYVILYLLLRVPMTYVPEVEPNRMRSGIWHLP